VHVLAYKCVGEERRGGGESNPRWDDTETKDKVQRRLFLDVVIRESAAIFELLAGKDKMQSGGIPPLSRRLHEDLHTIAETKGEVKS